MSELAGAEGDPSARLRSSFAGGAALFLLVLMAFWPVAAGSRSFFHLDLFYEHLPVWQATQRALLAGDSPFWLDGEYCGQPSLFIQEAPLFYPPTVPLLLTGLPVHRLADAFTLFHYWLAGFAAFLLLRDQTRHFAASLFGGIAWMLSARMVQSAVWPNAVAVSALVPLVLLGLVRIGRGERRGGVPLAGLAGGLALLAARPHSILAALPVVVAVGAAAVWSASNRRRALGDLLIAGSLAALLGSPSLVPMAALLEDTSRGAGLARAERDARALAAGPDLELVFLPRDGLSRWPEAAAYPGVIVGILFLAGLALWVRGRGFPRVLFAALLAAGVVGLVLAFGERGPYGLVADLPLLRSVRSPVRYLFSWSLALALGAALVLGWALSRLRRPALAAASVALVAADLVWHARRAAPTAPAAVYAAEPAVVPELRRRLGVDSAGFPRRYVSLADTIYPVFYPDPEMLVMTRDFEPLKMAIGMRFGLEAVNGYGPTLRATDALLAAWSPRAAVLAGVGAVVTSAPASPGEPPGQALRPAVHAFSEGLPRAILVAEARVVRPGAALAAALDPALDPARTVILENGEPLTRGAAWNEGAVALRLLSRRPGRIRFDVAIPDRGLLVVFDTWEAGWRATVDGRPEPVERADGAFRAVRLPPGRHRVALDYRPRGLKEGAGLGLVGILAAILVALRLPRG